MALSKSNLISKQTEIHLLKNPVTWIIFSVLLSIKFLLIHSYHSTDFEVHRNWMAITYNLPIHQWYYSNTSQWTLDYPPFFAHFEWLLSSLAAFIDESMLALREETVISYNILYFQRITVIISDLIYFIACACVIDSHIDETFTKIKNYHRKLRVAFYILLISNPALILLDNVHFQYNGMLYGIFLLSLYATFKNHLLIAALCYCILLNFKHIYIYYAPAFVAFYIYAYLLPLSRGFSLRIILLGFSILSILTISFGPFILRGGIPSFKQILSRLFPFQRGLTHANWAPNFWALYNFADLILANLLARMTANKCKNTFWSKLLKNCPPSTPEYTKGLVQEYSHSVLPNITSPVCFILIMLALTLCLWNFIQKKNRSTKELFLSSLALSAYSFFVFGWHVHEKALLMVFFPVALLAAQDHRLITPLSLLCISSIFAQLPLFFTPLEIFVKWVFVFAYFALCIFLGNSIWCIHLGELIRCPIGRFLLKLLFVAEFYSILGHRIIFGTNILNFLPLLATSVAGSLAVIYSYFSIVTTLFAEDFGLRFQKMKLMRKEKRILYSEFDKFIGVDKVQYIAGVDLSQCPNQPTFAIIGFIVLQYPNMRVVYCADEVVLMNSLGGIMPYLPEFFALREANPLRRAISRHLPHCPKIDILFVDSNGKWHSRGCGLACHVGFDIDTPTIGLAKKLNVFPLLALGLCKRDDLSSLESKIEQKCQHSENEASIFDLTLEILPEEQSSLKLAILRTKSSRTPFFISSGYGIDFESALEFAFHCVGKNSAKINPIRMSDLFSRRRAEEIFAC